MLLAGVPVCLRAGYWYYLPACWEEAAASWVWAAAGRKEAAATGAPPCDLVSKKNAAQNILVGPKFDFLEMVYWKP